MATSSDHALRIVFDINDGSVCAGAGTYESGSPKILWQSAVPYVTMQAQTPIESCKRLCAALLEVSSAAAREGIISLSREKVDVRHVEVSCILSSPWSFSSATFVSCDLKERKRIEHGLLDTLRADAYKSLLTSDRYEEWIAKYGGATIMQQYDQETLLAGYRVLQVRGHQARTIALRNFLFFAASEHFEKIRTILTDTFPHAHLVFHAPTYLFARAELVQPLDLTDRAVFVEIGYKYTVVSVVRCALLLDVEVFESGIFDLIHSIAPGAGSYTEAYSKAFSAAQSDAPMPDEAARVLAEWRTTVFERVLKITDGVVPPTHAVIAVDTPWYRQYAAALSSEPVWRFARGSEVNLKTFPLQHDEKDPSPKRERESSSMERMMQLFTAVDKFARHA